LDYTFLKHREFVYGLDDVSRNAELQSLITHPVFFFVCLDS
jgi:hypothetical protein